MDFGLDSANFLIDETFDLNSFLFHDWLIPPDDLVGHDSNRVTRRDKPMKLEVPPS